MSSTVSPATYSATCSEATGDLTTLGLLQQGARVLVVGDGNFSYSRAYLRANSARIGASEIDVTVTSLDTKSQLMDMYPKSRDILDELHDGGVHVRHGVNATKLESYSFEDNEPIKFDRIVFNFPHYAAEGGIGNKNKRNKIHHHRQLLGDFFASASHVLASDGQIWVTLCAGQGGTRLERKTRAVGDTWQIVHCAADAGLKAFWTEDGISHVFRHEAPGRKACFPIEWTRDMSFWVTDEQMFTEELLHDVVHKHFSPDTMDVSISLLDEYRCEKSGRKSVTYRLDISSSSLALSRDRVNTLAQATLSDIGSSSFGAFRAK
ncbi:uncharacterized protein PITG_03093 [Phytophthora infestans T30-4]|uniref:FDX-ACB domain-containing protein n=1 Tax=Phytophthora infestans (strain T30-4) TaxID=403677 RepID=D0MZC5_PHYIT|nr:uncharacterized protein PITG_03093 [Phytophthora infestans T30-4]EEY65588.1 conserved hypothetical protein [Phytophthora infestans T30-4]|eukprot:XP_002906187.1 conserved hypothetical protein [Phytophthora infestans T30-4]